MNGHRSRHVAPCIVLAQWSSVQHPPMELPAMGLGCWETRGRCGVVWCGECGEERTAEGAGAGAQSRSCGFGRFGHVLLPQMLPCPCLPSVRPVYPLKCRASERMPRQVGAVENWRRHMLCDLRRYPREPPEISFAVVVNLDAAAQMV